MPTRAAVANQGPPPLSSRVLRALSRLGLAALDVLLPPCCLTCDAPVAAQGQFCADCFARVSFVSDPCCARCGVPFASVAEADPGLTCAVCAAAPPAYRRARSALRYDAQSKALILAFKHGDRPELARALAPHMQRAGAALLREADTLVPVPLHRARLYQRRYNQAGMLALAVGKLAARPVAIDALVRLRRTAPLGVTSAIGRAAELAGAFAVRPSRAAAVAGRRVLLIDDVMTSGATAEACARVLRAAGAACVDVLAAARVPDPRTRGPVLLFAPDRTN